MKRVSLLFLTLVLALPDLLLPYKPLENPNFRELAIQSPKSFGLRRGKVAEDYLMKLAERLPAEIQQGAKKHLQDLPLSPD